MFLIALGLAGLLFGVGSSEVRKFEHAAAADIAQKLEGPSKKVKVKTKMDPFEALGGRIKSATIYAESFSVTGLPFFTEPEYSTRGRLGELKFEMSKFELSKLPVQKLAARIPDCRFDLGLAQRHGRIRLTRSGLGVGRVEVLQAGLQTFIQRKYPTLRNLEVKIVPGQAILTGAGRFVVLDASFRIETELESVDGNRISMRQPKIWVNGQLAESGATQAILSLLNPVIDLDKDLQLYGALRTASVQLEEGRLIAEGPAKIPLRPAGTSDAPKRLISEVIHFLFAEYHLPHA